MNTNEKILENHANAMDMVYKALNDNGSDKVVDGDKKTVDGVQWNDLTMGELHNNT